MDKQFFYKHDMVDVFQLSKIMSISSVENIRDNLLREYGINFHKAFTKDEILKLQSEISVSGDVNNDNRIIDVISKVNYDLCKEIIEFFKAKKVLMTDVTNLENELEADIVNKDNVDKLVSKIIEK